MGLFSTHLIKTHPDLEYMTVPEKGMFKELKKGGGMSFFRIGYCVVCDAEMINSKKYCSKKCFDSVKGDETDGDEEEEE